MFEVVDFECKINQRKGVYTINICKKEKNTYEWEVVKTIKYKERPTVPEMHAKARMVIKSLAGAI